MSLILITGSCGLVGSESVNFFHKKGFEIIGIDNNLRQKFFGKDGSTERVKKEIIRNNKNYIHKDIDIRNYIKLEKIFKNYKKDIKLIIHCAAQPSHDYAKNNSILDFQVNGQGTHNLLELTKKYCPDSPFIFMSTNKVYGDNPNKLSFFSNQKRFELKKSHKLYKGIDETFRIDECIHSFFGVSKTYADLLVQEYGKNIGLKGYNGKQVRDNIHSLDLVNCFWEFFKKPLKGVVFNIGGGRKSNCSIIEAIEIIENKLQRKIKKEFIKQNRVGDHIWYITNNSKFKKYYPNWKQKFNTKDIIYELINSYS